MSHELATLKFFCTDRKNFTLYHAFVKEIPNMEKELKMLHNLIANYYNKYTHDSIKQGDLAPFFDLQYPQHKDREVFFKIIDTMWETEISDELTVDLLEQMKEKHHASKIVNKLLPAMGGTKFDILPHIREDVDAYVREMANPPSETETLAPCKLTTRELVEAEIANKGWKTPLNNLTDLIGGIRRQSNGLIYAYVESGKTSFVMKVIAKVAEQMKGDESILVCGNEENARRLCGRLTMAFCECTTAQIEDNPDYYDDMKMNMGYDRVNVFDNITAGEQVQDLVEEYRPALLVVDSATDVEVKVDRQYRDGVNYLKGLFKWYRSLGNLYNMAVVNVAQAIFKDGAPNKNQWLELPDVYGCRTAIQSALDWSVGLGIIPGDATKEMMRYCNVTKNKYGDHGKFLAKFDKYINKWSDL